MASLFQIMRRRVRKQVSSRPQRRHRCFFEPLESRNLLAVGVIPNDPDFPHQWALHNTGQSGGIVDADIDAPQAWEITTGSMQTVVAILDDGVDYTHPDLYLNIWLNQAEIPANIANNLSDADGDGILSFRDLNAPVNASYTSDLNGNGYIDGGDLLADPNWENGLDEDTNGRIDDLVGWDFRDGDNDPQSAVGEGHGTSAARMIGAMGNNGVAGAGINWEIRMIPVRIRSGSGSEIVNSQVATGIDYAAESEASIINAGFRGNPRATADEFSQELFDAIDRSRQAGKLFVAAAGNGARDTDTHPWYPQSYESDNIISSGALSDTGDQLSLSSITNWGATTVDYAVSTYNGTTSHALAHATGIAALIKSIHPAWTYSQIKARMLGTVDPVASLAGQTVTGGRLNAARAVGFIEPTLVFADSFELGSNSNDWAGKWVEDSQNDWFRSTQRATDGSYSAEVDGRATDATLTLSNPIDLSGYSSAELTFDWLIESGFDSGEYLALDISTDGGATWVTDVLRLDGNSSQENTWHSETVNLTPYALSNVLARFRVNVSRSDEDANVDNVKITGTLPVGSNESPVADGDAYTTAEDSVLNVAAPGVLDEDTDPESDPLSATLVANATHGLVILNADGSFNYTPDADYHGPDSFTYQANDGTSDSNLATVNLTVTPVNDAPTADSQSVAVKENTDKSITLSASDVEGSSLTYTVQTGPTSGILSGTAPNLVYTPDTGFTGADSFTFLAHDGELDSKVATVTINVAENSAPVADSQAVSVDEDGSAPITLSGSDADGDPITYELVGLPSDGVLTGSAPNLTYTPDADFNGADSFAFRVNDGTDDSALATVTITANPVNDVPVADAQVLSTDEDTALAVTLTGSDIDGDALSFAIVSGPAHGSLSGTAPNLTYTPDADFHGSDSFGFKANDGTADSATAVVSITVDPVNDAPVAGNDNYAADQDTALAVAASGVLQNDSDADGDAVSAVPWSGSSSQGGEVVLNADGSFTYTPPAGYTGMDTFSYAPTDGSVSGNPATVSIEVSAASANALYVYDIRFESAWGGWLRRAVFEIRSDTNGDGQGGAGDDVAAGVAITVEFNGQIYVGTTDANGVFRTSWNWRPPAGTYAEVVDMALADYSWDPLALDLEDDSDGDGLPDGVL